MSMHWSERIARELAERSREQRIATGITPSGPIHIGNIREMITADAIYRNLVHLGANARFYFIGDTFDPLRRRYPFLPEDYEQYVGMPLSRIPCPENCCESYAMHYLRPFLDSLEEYGIEAEVMLVHEMYERGEYEDAIRIALQNRDRIRRILEEVTGRKLEEDWYPYRPICSSCGRMTHTKITSIEENYVNYRCEFCGNEGRAGFRGDGKLPWRVDWPARWWMLGITCEPMGKDHAAAGGSYDSGRRIAKEIYGIDPPYPVVYEWIELKGVGAFKKSRGIFISTWDWLEFAEPEILRYLILKTKQTKAIIFDPRDLPDLYDEFDSFIKRVSRLDDIDSEKERRNLQTLYRIVLAKRRRYPRVLVPFRFAAMLSQVLREGEDERLASILKRCGFSENGLEREDLEYAWLRIRLARRWLELYAPDEYKLRVMVDDPRDIARMLDDEQVRALEILAERLSRKREWRAEEVQSEIYRVAREILGVESARVFQAIYLALLGRREGPRAGPFIVSLGVEKVVERFESVVKASREL